MSDKFDARSHLIILKGKGGAAEYLPVAARIAWFRAEHPDGHIALDAHTITDQIAIFHARVSVPDAGSAEGWGSETPRDFGDFIEKASTKALGRALLALGYGTLQAGDELAEGERIADAPVPARLPSAEAKGTQRTPVARSDAPRAAGMPQKVSDWTSAELLAYASNEAMLPGKRKAAFGHYLARLTSAGAVNDACALMTALHPEDVGACRDAALAALREPAGVNG